MPGTIDFTRLSGVLAAAVFVYCFSVPRYIQVCSPSETITESPTFELDSMRNFPGFETAIFTTISSREGNVPPKSTIARWSTWYDLCLSSTSPVSFSSALASGES